MNRRSGKLRLKWKPTGSGMATLLVMSVLLALLAGCSAQSSEPPSASKSGPASQVAPQIKMSPNVPQIVRAETPGSYQGGARLAIDEASFDFGKVKLEEWVQPVFHIKNVGDAPLTITGEPLVRALEGC